MKAICDARNLVTRQGSNNGEKPTNDATRSSGSARSNIQIASKVVSKSKNGSERRVTRSGANSNPVETTKDNKNSKPTNSIKLDPHLTKSIVKTSTRVEGKKLPPMLCCPPEIIIEIANALLMNASREQLDLRDRLREKRSILLPIALISKCFLRFLGSRLNNHLELCHFSTHRMLKFAKKLDAKPRIGYLSMTVFLAPIEKIALVDEKARQQLVKDRAEALDILLRKCDRLEALVIVFNNDCSTMTKEDWKSLTDVLIKYDLPSIKKLQISKEDWGDLRILRSMGLEALTRKMPSLESLDIDQTESEDLDRFHPMFIPQTLKRIRMDWICFHLEDLQFVNKVNCNLSSLDLVACRFNYLSFRRMIFQVQDKLESLQVRLCSFNVFNNTFEEVEEEPGTKRSVFKNLKYLHLDFSSPSLETKLDLQHRDYKALFNWFLDSPTLKTIHTTPVQSVWEPLFSLIRSGRLTENSRQLTIITFSKKIKAKVTPAACTRENRKYAISFPICFCHDSEARIQMVCKEEGLSCQSEKLGFIPPEFHHGNRPKFRNNVLLTLWRISVTGNENLA
jgi:hypothetical protein